MWRMPGSGAIILAPRAAQGCLIFLLLAPASCFSFGIESAEQVFVSEADTGETGLFCRFQACFGLGHGGGRGIVHQEFRGKAQEGIRYVGIYAGYEGRQPVDFIFIDIPGDKRRAGHERRRRSAFRGPLGGPREIVQYL